MTSSRGLVVERKVLCVHLWAHICTHGFLKTFFVFLFIRLMFHRAVVPAHHVPLIFVAIRILTDFRTECRWGVNSLPGLLSSGQLTTISHAQWQKSTLPRIETLQRAAYQTGKKTLLSKPAIAANKVIYKEPTPFQEQMRSPLSRFTIIGILFLWRSAIGGTISRVNFSMSNHVGVQLCSRLWFRTFFSSCGTVMPSLKQTYAMHVSMKVVGTGSLHSITLIFFLCQTVSNVVLCIELFLQRCPR